MWAPLLLRCVGSSLVVVQDSSRVAMGELLLLLSGGRPPLELLVLWLLSNCNV